MNTSGILAVVDAEKQTVSREIALPGQPDSVAVSKDGKYAAVVLIQSETLNVFERG